MSLPRCPFVMPFGHQRCERRRFHFPLKHRGEEHIYWSASWLVMSAQETDPE
jgi:hypothetical protein